MNTLNIVLGEAQTQRPAHLGEDVVPRIKEVEDPEVYLFRGFHPVHLGHLLDDQGRYEVKHKLGHGGSATVWLATDKITRKYVAVKVIRTGALSIHLKALKISRELREAYDGHPGREYILLHEYNYFGIDGFNGFHPCLVMPVAGPRVVDFWMHRNLKGETARNFAQQVARGVAYLHKHGVCHGDLQPSNILIQIANFDSWTEEEVNTRFGKPVIDPFDSKNNPDPGPCAPSYLVRPAKLSSLEAQCLSNKILIVDFGESFYLTDPPDGLSSLGASNNYSAPELIFQTKVSAATEIWALACTLFAIRTGQDLFDTFYNEEHEVTEQMVQLLGRFPEPWSTIWKERGYNVNDERMPTGKRTPLEIGHSLAKLIRRPLVRPLLRPELREQVIPISEKEIIIFSDLLHKMLKLLPSQRITAGEVADHSWFRAEYPN